MAYLAASFLPEGVEDVRRDFRLAQKTLAEGPRVRHERRHRARDSSSLAPPNAPSPNVPQETAPAQMKAPPRKTRTKPSRRWSRA